MTEVFAWGKPGTRNDIIMTDSETAATINGYVKMVSLNPPDDEKFYVIDETGNWSYPLNNDVIKAERQRRILEAWPVEKQMEAYSDNVRGDATKLNELMHFLNKIKEDLPYIKN